MTSSAVQLPGGLKADPAALMASLQLMPSPVPNPEIKYTKVASCSNSARSTKSHPYQHYQYVKPPLMLV
ncbi:retinal dehydrogenase 2 [Tachysurus ichikawai]